jgi:hypothetical protein
VTNRRSEKEVVVWDLDSTIADTRHRSHLAPTQGGPSWEAFALECGNDGVIEGTAQLARLIGQKYQNFFVSGRHRVASKLTDYWLTNVARVPWDHVRLWRPGDPQNNGRFKVRAIREIQASGRVVHLVVDDWVPTCEAIEAELGLPVLCVNPRYDWTLPPGHQDNPVQDPRETKDGSQPAVP